MPSPTFLHSARRLRPPYVRLAGEARVPGGVWQVLVAVLAVLVVMAGVPAAADVWVRNLMSTSFGIGGAGIQVYRYDQANAALFTAKADFLSGTLENLYVDDPDGDGDPELYLSFDWWDDGWDDRECFDVSGGEAQYPVKVIIDTSVAAGDDIRVVEHLPTNPSLANPVPHYTEWRVDPSQTTVWFQAEQASSGRYCVYFNNPSNPGSTSDQFAPFTYTSGQSISYWSLGGGTSRVYSYVDNNTVTYNGTTVTLGTGQSVTFSSTSATEVTATGPIEVARIGANTETFVPEGYASTRFTFPTERRDQRFYLRSLGGPTTIEVYSNGVLVGTQGIDNGVHYMDLPGDPNYLTLKSNPSVPFVALHQAISGSWDVFPGVPWLDEPLFGIPSTSLYAGSDVAQTINWARSDGGSGTANLTVGSVFQSANLNWRLGTTPAYRLTGSQYFAAIQQADGDGEESTAFLPLSLLSQTYILPASSNYIAFACPVPGTVISLNGISAGTCAGTGVGKLLVNANQSAGTVIETDYPVYLYYEANLDERQLLGVKGAIPEADYVAVAVAENCGTWTSPVVDTTGVFGQAYLVVDNESTVEYQLSFDGGPFVGPDATTSTYFVEGSILPYQYDSVATSTRIRVELCGNAAANIAEIGFGYDLNEVALDPITARHEIVAVGQAGNLLRVKPQPDVTRLELVSVTGSPDTFVIGTDQSPPQIQGIAGTVTATSNDFVSQPFTVTVADATPQMANIRVDIVSETAGSDLKLAVGVDLALNISPP